MAKIFRRTIRGRTLPNWYADIWHDNRHIMRCTGTSNRRLALKARQKFVEQLKAEAHSRELDARKAGCADDLAALAYCTGCGRPMNRFLSASRVEGGFFCSKECHERWREFCEKPEIPTLREFRERFLASVETRCRPKTVRFYKGCCARLLEFLPWENMRLDRIDGAIIQSYIDHRKPTAAIASLNAELRTLHVILTLAEEWRLIERAPRIRRVKGENARSFVLSHGDEVRYLAAAPPLLHDFAILALDCGVRVDEGLSLEWTDTYLAEGYIFIRHSKSRQRNLPLTTRSRVVLESRRVVSQSIYVFTAPDGIGRAAQSTLNHQHEVLREQLKLDLKFVPHDLRRTFATRLEESGVRPNIILALLGDSSLSMLRKYVRPQPETLALAVRELESANEAKRTLLLTSGQNETTGLSNTSATTQAE